jgi:hypothetical protein
MHRTEPSQSIFDSVVWQSNGCMLSLPDGPERSYPENDALAQAIAYLPE